MADANTKLHNDTQTWSQVEAPQQHFANTMGVTWGATGQIGNQAGVLQATAIHPFQDVVLPAAASVGQAFGQAAKKAVCVTVSAAIPKRALALRDPGVHGPISAFTS